jgi:hypothetical protein
MKRPGPSARLRKTFPPPSPRPLKDGSAPVTSGMTQTFSASRTSALPPPAVRSLPRGLQPKARWVPFGLYLGLTGSTSVSRVETVSPSAEATIS